MRYTVTRRKRSWPAKWCNLLVYLKDRENYSFKFIADVLQREFKVALTRNACQGKYSRLKAEGFELSTDTIEEYLP